MTKHLVARLVDRWEREARVALPRDWVVADPVRLDVEQVDQVFHLYSLAYGAIGKQTDDPRDLLSGFDYMWVRDLDGDQVIDVFIGYKKTHAGNKIALFGSDGSSAAKRLVISKMTRLLQSRGWYCELSHRPAQLAEAAGVVPIDDEDVVRSVLRIPLEWLGGGQYIRTITGIGPAKKGLWGKPNVR